MLRYCCREEDKPVEQERAEIVKDLQTPEEPVAAAETVEAAEPQEDEEEKVGKALQVFDIVWQYFFNFSGTSRQSECDSRMQFSRLSHRRWRRRRWVRRLLIALCLAILQYFAL